MIYLFDILLEHLRTLFV